MDPQDTSPDALISAVAKKDGVPAELFEILLMCEHLYSTLCKTVWNKGETWEQYIERVRVYDPTAATFKRIHFALLFGHDLPGVDEDADASRYKARPAPSQLNLIHGQGVPLRRLLAAGLKMINVNESHLEFRHMIRKAFINLCQLHQIARGLKKEPDQDQEKTTQDSIRRGDNLLLQQQLQASRMWFAALESFAKDPWSKRYHRQYVRDCQSTSATELETIIEEKEEDLDPISVVINSAYDGNLTEENLRAADVLTPYQVGLSSKVLDAMSDLIADSLPEPTTAEEIRELFQTLSEDDFNADNNISTTVLENDFDADSTIAPSLPGAPANVVCACEFAQSDKDKVYASRGNLKLNIHFFYGSGNIEIRST